MKQTLAQAQDDDQALLAQKQQKTLDKFVKDFREEVEGGDGLPQGLRHADCKNAPKKTATPTPSTATTGTTPQTETTADPPQ